MFLAGAILLNSFVLRSETRLWRLVHMGARVRRGY